MSARREAHELAQHYFGTIARKAGMRWDADNVAEIDALVDAIIEAARYQVLHEQLDEQAKGHR